MRLRHGLTSPVLCNQTCGIFVPCSRGLCRCLSKHRCVKEVYAENWLLIGWDKNRLDLGASPGGCVLRIYLRSDFPGPKRGIPPVIGSDPYFVSSPLCGLLVASLPAYLAHRAGPGVRRWERGAWSFALLPSVLTHTIFVAGQVLLSPRVLCILPPLSRKA